MGWLYKNEITGQYFEACENDAFVYLPLMEKCILKDENTIELIDTGQRIEGIKEKPSLIAKLPYILNSEEINAFCFRKAVKEGLIVNSIKGEVDYEKVNIAFIASDGERIEIKYL